MCEKSFELMVSKTPIDQAKSAPHIAKCCSDLPFCPADRPLAPGNVPSVGVSPSRRRAKRELRLKLEMRPYKAARTRPLPSPLLDRDKSLGRNGRCVLRHDRSDSKIIQIDQIDLNDTNRLDTALYPVEIPI